MPVQQLRGAAGPCLETVTKHIGEAINRAVDFVTVTLPDPGALYYNDNWQRISDTATQALAVQRQTIMRYQARARRVITFAFGLTAVLGFVAAASAPYSDSTLLKVGCLISVIGSLAGTPVYIKINAHYKDQISKLTRQINSS